MSTVDKYFVNADDAFKYSQLIIGDDKLMGEIIEVIQDCNIIRFVDRRTGKVLEGFNYKDINVWTVSAFRHFFYTALWREVINSLKECKVDPRNL